MRFLAESWNDAMSHQCEWNEFDPNDIRTHPESNMLVQVKYADGRQADETYSRELGVFFRVCALPESTLALSKRWRYITPRQSLRNTVGRGVGSAVPYSSRSIAA
jgi:hypothetical protein